MSQPTVGPAHKPHPDLSNLEHLSQLTRQLSRRSSRSSLEHGYPLGRVISTTSSIYDRQIPAIERHNVLDESVPENEAVETPGIDRSNSSGFQGGLNLKNTRSRQSHRSNRSGLKRKISNFDAVEGGDSDEEDDAAEEGDEDNGESWLTS